MNLLVQQGTVYEESYWTVHPYRFSCVDECVSCWNQMMEWTVDTFGPAPVDGIWTPGARWYANNAKFWFRDQRDRDWFLLRWN